MKVTFKYIDPDQIQVGDIIACYRHDDQHEQANARVVAIEMERKAGVWVIRDCTYAFEYRLWLTCRHISLKRLDAEGGPPYRWHRFPWNGVSRYVLL